MKVAFKTEKGIEEFGQGMSLDGVPAGAAFVIFDVPPTSFGSVHGATGRSGGWWYTAGWSGSYHDAWFSPRIVAWAKGKRKFRTINKMVREAKAAVAAARIDTCTARFAARQMVREGD